MTPTILVIEDEKTTRHSITQFLESQGFEVLSADNGREGISLAKGHLPDLIICDIMMPEMDGYEVLIELQSNSETLTIPFIFLTATSDQNGFRQSMEMGADDYLSKPITSAALLNAIHCRLQKQASNAQKYAQQTECGVQLHQVNQEMRQMRQYADLKHELLERLLSGLKESLPLLYRHLMEDLHPPSNAEQNAIAPPYAQHLVRAIALMNEISEFNRTLTPENALTLKEFPFSQSSSSEQKEVRDGVASNR